MIEKVEVTCKDDKTCLIGYIDLEQTLFDIQDPHTWRIMIYTARFDLNIHIGEGWPIDKRTIKDIVRLETKEVLYSNY